MARTKEGYSNGPLSSFWKEHCIRDGHSQPGNPHSAGEKELHKQGDGLSKEKARQILKDGSVRGHKLTTKQKGYMGLIAGGGHPSK